MTGWMPYRVLQCQHALCGHHHLRELIYLLEEQDQAWVGDMIEPLTHANHQDKLNCADAKTLDYNSQKYQSEVGDLHDGSDDVWRFMTRSNVPFRGQYLWVPRLSL
jgi:transposase